MRVHAVVLCVGLLAPCRVALATDTSPGQDTTQAAQSSFDLLKGLAGKWIGSVTTQPPNPDIEGSIRVTMRVASRGSVLEHEIAPGGVPEPTMIYVEGGRLMLVHYCEAGNRPRLVALHSSDSRTVDFEFADISGSTMPVYLRQFVFTISGANHHTEDWTFVMPDLKLLRAHFDLKRATKGSPPAAGKTRGHRR